MLLRGVTERAVPDREPEKRPVPAFDPIGHGRSVPAAAFELFCRFSDEKTGDADRPCLRARPRRWNRDFCSLVTGH